MAKITQAQWKRYISKLRQINDKAADDFLSEVVSHGGYGNIERQKLIDLAYGISTKYGEASAALSAEMYDAIAELSKAAVPAALPAETASYSDVARTVNGILKNTGSDKVLAQGVGRLVKRAGADTMLQNAYRDRPKGKGSKRRHSGAEVAWIPYGDTCPFCLTLASKGWQNQTEWGANNHAEHIHANCDCTYAVRFNNNFSVEGYDPDEYKKMYDDAEGSTPNEKINSMRRMQYQDPATREKINAQKRAAYAARKELDNSAISSTMGLTESAMQRRDSGIIAEPMPKEQFDAIARGFARQGGEIRTDAEARAFLDWKKVEGATIDEKLIFLRENPSRSAVFEELIHTAQIRNGEIVEIPKDAILAEIHAKEKLLKYADAYKLTDAEIDATRRLLDIDREDLKAWEKKNGL